MLLLRHPHRGAGKRRPPAFVSHLRLHGSCHSVPPSRRMLCKLLRQQAHHPASTTPARRIPAVTAAVTCHAVPRHALRTALRALGVEGQLQRRGVLPWRHRDHTTALRSCRDRSKPREGPTQGEGLPPAPSHRCCALASKAARALSQQGRPGRQALGHVRQCWGREGMLRLCGAKPRGRNRPPNTRRCMVRSDSHPGENSGSLQCVSKITLCRQVMAQIGP